MLIYVRLNDIMPVIAESLYYEDWLQSLISDKQSLCTRPDFSCRTNAFIFAVTQNLPTVSFITLILITSDRSDIYTRDTEECAKWKVRNQMRSVRFIPCPNIFLGRGSDVNNKQSEARNRFRSYCLPRSLPRIIN